MTTIALGAGVASARDSLGMQDHPLLLVILVAGFSLLPFLLLLLTSYARIAVVLSVLRSTFSPAQIPSGQIITGLALLLTIYVMAPTGQRDAASVDTIRKQLAEIEGRLAAVTARLERESPDFAALASPKPLAVDEVQRLLKDAAHCA